MNGKALKDCKKEVEHCKWLSSESDILVGEVSSPKYNLYHRSVDTFNALLLL